MNNKEKYSVDQIAMMPELILKQDAVRAILDPQKLYTKEEALTIVKDALNREVD